MEKGRRCGREFLLFSVKTRVRGKKVIPNPHDTKSCENLFFSRIRETCSGRKVSRVIPDWNSHGFSHEEKKIRESPGKMSRIQRQKKMSNTSMTCETNNNIFFCTKKCYFPLNVLFQMHWQVRDQLRRESLEHPVDGSFRRLLNLWRWVLCVLCSCNQKSPSCAALCVCRLCLRRRVVTHRPLCERWEHPEDRIRTSSPLWQRCEHQDWPRSTTITTMVCCYGW